MGNSGSSTLNRRYSDSPVTVSDPLKSEIRFMSIASALETGLGIRFKNNLERKLVVDSWMHMMAEDTHNGVFYREFEFFIEQLRGNVNLISLLDPDCPDGTIFDSMYDLRQIIIIVGIETAYHFRCLDDTDRNRIIKWYLTSRCLEMSDDIAALIRQRAIRAVKVQAINI